MASDLPRWRALLRDWAIRLVGTRSTRSPRLIKNRSKDPDTCRQSSSAQTRSSSSSRAHASSAPNPARPTWTVRSPSSSPVVALTPAIVCERLWVSAPSTIMTLVLLCDCRWTAGGHGLLRALPRSYQGTPDIPDRRRATKQKEVRPAGRQPQRESARRRSGPSSQRRTSPTPRITTASLEALGGLGIVGDVEHGCDVTEDAFDLLEDVVDDLYLRRFGPTDAPAFTRREAYEIARAAVANPKATILPLETTGDGRPAMRARLAGVARDELERRKRLFGILTFDDLLTRLDSTLADPATGAFAVAKLRERYRIALVDEFQDTDPIQWDIVRRAFAENVEGGGPTQRALVLIGDPKQAIYAFRGADVHAYLAAARVAGDEQTLATNWRSDQDLISALDAMFGGARLGHEEILYHTVEAVPAHRDRRLRGAPSDAALRIRG